MNRKLIIFILCIGLICSNINVYAYDKALTNTGDATNISAWHQSKKENDPSVPDNAWNFEVAPNRTLGYMGCSYYAASYMLVKMNEENPKDGFTPVQLAQNIKQNKLYTERNYVDWNNLPILYPNITEVISKSPCKGTTLDEQLIYIKGKINEGYYVIACIVSDKHKYGHYIFIDGFTSNNQLSIGDSADPANIWSESYGQQSDVYINDISLFKCKNSNSYSSNSIYDNVKLDNYMNYRETQLYKKLNND